MPRFPGSESGASKVSVAFPLVDPLPSAGSAAAGAMRSMVRPALFARFLGTMGPSDSLETCMSVVRQEAFSDRPSPPLDEGISRVSRFPRIELPHMLRFFDSAASAGNLRIPLPAVWPSPSGDKVGTPIEVISELDGWPACAPVNASPATLPPPAHDSGLERFATPFLCGSFIRYSMPVLPGAFRLSPFLPPPRGRKMCRFPGCERLRSPSQPRPIANRTDSTHGQKPDERWLWSWCGVNHQSSGVHVDPWVPLPVETIIKGIS